MPTFSSHGIGVGARMGAEVAGRKDAVLGTDCAGVGAEDSTGLDSDVVFLRGDGDGADVVSAKGASDAAAVGTEADVEDDAGM